MKRRVFVAGLGAALAWHGAVAQQQPKVPRVGFLAGRSRSTPSNPDAWYDSFVQGMRDLGYVDGKNVVIEWRFADNHLERTAKLAEELVQLKPDVVVTHYMTAVRELQKASPTVPIVSTVLINPVSAGDAKSLSHPGGRTTGLSTFSAELSGKRIELLKAILPKLSRIAMLMNPDTPTMGYALLASVKQAAAPLNIDVLTAEATTAEGIDRAFVQMKAAHADALLIPNNPYFPTRARQIGDLTIRHKLPTASPYAELAEAGGLLSYGPNLRSTYRTAASYVDRILKGAKPGDLPIEQPTEVELVINRRTARALGLNVPQDLLLRADRVVD
jgi:putative ABC transport system substrate-binding protein